MAHVVHYNRVKFPNDSFSFIVLLTNMAAVMSGENHLHLAMLKALLHCEMFRATCLAMLWRDKSSETFHSVTYPATAKDVARQVARAVAESRRSSLLSIPQTDISLFIQLIRRTVYFRLQIYFNETKILNKLRRFTIGKAKS